MYDMFTLFALFFHLALTKQYTKFLCFRLHQSCRYIGSFFFLQVIVKVKQTVISSYTISKGEE